MKEILKYSIIGAAAVLSLASCEKEAAENAIMGPAENIFSVYPLAIVPPAEGGDFDLIISGKEAWKLEVLETNVEDEDWCTFSSISGEGADTVRITVTPSFSPTVNRSMVIIPQPFYGNIIRIFLHLLQLFIRKKIIYQLQAVRIFF